MKMDDDGGRMRSRARVVDGWVERKTSVRQCEIEHTGRGCATRKTRINTGPEAGIDDERPERMTEETWADKGKEMQACRMAGN